LPTGLARPGFRLCRAIDDVGAIQLVTSVCASSVSTAYQFTCSQLVDGIEVINVVEDEVDVVLLARRRQVPHAVAAQERIIRGIAPVLDDLVNHCVVWLIPRLQQVPRDAPAAEPVLLPELATALARQQKYPIMPGHEVPRLRSGVAQTCGVRDCS
jgi:hypothetical protein